MLVQNRTEFPEPVLRIRILRQSMDLMRVLPQVIQVLCRFRQPECRLRLVKSPHQPFRLPGLVRTPHPFVTVVLTINTVRHIIANIAVMPIRYCTHQVITFIHTVAPAKSIMPWRYRGRPKYDLPLHDPWHI